MLISIVIVSWNGKEDLARCLNSLRSQTDQRYEIIVVDNGSADGTPALIKEEFPEVKLCELAENSGFSEGCNRGIELASGSWIATLNQDTTVDPHWLVELRKHIQRGGADLGMLQPNLLFMHEPDLHNSTGILLTTNGGGTDRDFRVPASSDEVAEEILCPTAGAALYKREMLDQVRLGSGYFDRTFFMYWEDLDLGWRCRLAGWRAMYVPSAVVYHRYQGSSKKIGARYAELQCRKNRLRSLLKNGSLYFLLRTSAHSVRDFFAGLKHNGLVAVPNLFSAIYDGLRQRKEVTRMLQTGRRKLEKEWVTPPPRSPH